MLRSADGEMVTDLLDTDHYCHLHKYQIRLDQYGRRCVVGCLLFNCCTVTALLIVLELIVSDSNYSCDEKR